MARDDLSHDVTVVDPNGVMDLRGAADQRLDTTSGRKFDLGDRLPIERIGHGNRQDGIVGFRAIEVHREELETARLVVGDLPKSVGIHRGCRVEDLEIEALTEGLVEGVCVDQFLFEEDGDDG